MRREKRERLGPEVIPRKIHSRDTTCNPEDGVGGGEEG